MNIIETLKASGKQLLELLKAEAAKQSPEVLAAVNRVIVEAGDFGKDMADIAAAAVAGELNDGELEWLVKQRLEAAVIAALTMEGLAAIKLEAIKDDVLKLIGSVIGSAVKAV